MQLLGYGHRACARHVARGHLVLGIVIRRVSIREGGTSGRVAMKRDAAGPRN